MPRPFGFGLSGFLLPTFPRTKGNRGVHGSKHKHFKTAGREPARVFGGQRRWPPFDPGETGPTNRGSGLTFFFSLPRLPWKTLESLELLHPLRMLMAQKK